MIKIFFIALIIFCTFSLQAAEVETKKQLQKLIQFALKNNPKWSAIQLNTKIAAEKINESGAWSDSKLKITQFGESIQTRVGPQERIYSFSQKLPFWGENSFAQQAAKSGKEKSIHNVQAKKFNFVSLIEQSYFEAWKLQELEMLFNEYLKVIQKLSQFKVNNARQSIGAFSNVYRSRAELSEVHYNLSLLKDQQIAIHARLKQLLGGKNELLNGFEKPSISRFDLSLKQAIEAALQNNSYLKEKQTDVVLITAKRDQAENATWAPNIELGVNYFEIGKSDLDVPNSGKDAYSFSIGMNLPFGSKKSSLSQQMRFKEKQSHFVLSNVKNELRSQVTRIFYQLENAKKRVSLFEKQLLPEAINTKNNTQNLFRSGNVTVIDLLETEKIILDIKMKTLQAKIDYLNKFSEMKVILGEGN